MRKMEQTHNFAASSQLVTHVIQSTGAVRPAESPIRNTPTFQTTFQLGAPTIINPPQMRKSSSNAGQLFQTTPYAAAATRTSFQDSNIFGYKRNDSPTVQQSAREQLNNSQMNRTLANPSKTYKSSIIVYKPEEELAAVTKKQQIKETQYVDGRRMVIGGSSTRDEKNWKSTVFSNDGQT